MINHKSIVVALAFASVAPLACKSAAVPPPLAQAREVFERAERGRARELAPTYVYQARQALSRAENAYKAEGAEQRTLDLSYVALREAQQAEARAELQYWRRAGEPALAKADLEEPLEYAPPQVEGTTVTRTERGLVMSLQANVLFAPNKSDLLPEAADRLSKVAKQLASSDQQIMVEGHTDALGTDEKNQQLSMARANAVRDLLVENGVPAERIISIGRGESNPIADNSTAEGRASNRRVEIVVEPRAG